MNNARTRELLKEIVFKQYYKLVWLVFVKRFHDFLCLLKLFLESVIVLSIFSKCNDLLTPILLFVSCIRLLIFSAILKVVSYSFFFLWKYELCFFLPLWPILFWILLSASPSWVYPRLILILFSFIFTLIFLICILAYCYCWHPVTHNCCSCNLTQS